MTVMSNGVPAKFLEIKAALDGYARMFSFYKNVSISYDSTSLRLNITTDDNFYYVELKKEDAGYSIYLKKTTRVLRRWPALRNCPECIQWLCL